MERVFLAAMSKPPAESSNWKYLADLLAEAVRNSGLSVIRIAKDSGTSRQYIYELMKGIGNPSVDQLVRIFDATGTSLERLLQEKSFYGRDKKFHDKVQLILNEKGTRAVALKVIVEGPNFGN